MLNDSGEVWETKSFNGNDSLSTGSIHVTVLLYDTCCKHVPKWKAADVLQSRDGLRYVLEEFAGFEFDAGNDAPSGERWKCKSLLTDVSAVYSLRYEFSTLAEPAWKPGDVVQNAGSGNTYILVHFEKFICNGERWSYKTDKLGSTRYGAEFLYSDFFKKQWEAQAKYKDGSLDALEATLSSAATT